MMPNSLKKDDYLIAFIVLWLNSNRLLAFDER